MNKHIILIVPALLTISAISYSQNPKVKITNAKEVKVYGGNVKIDTATIYVNNTSARIYVKTKKESYDSLSKYPHYIKENRPRPEMVYVTTLTFINVDSTNQQSSIAINLIFEKPVYAASLTSPIGIIRHGLRPDNKVYSLICNDIMLNSFDIEVLSEIRPLITIAGVAGAFNH